ncbi:hypothetical protein FQN60_012277 [Etheostoma spectabile]|uniref:Uncharacterized protein n=1 Tax=Etheostoma spectabile TaxID=54343 RepID=A0A5J5DPE9_9PERO|nr:hypothetical protein FQN60_012277 [Etheostoma spectabile]
MRMTLWSSKLRYGIPSRTAEPTCIARGQQSPCGVLSRAQGAMGRGHSQAYVSCLTCSHHLEWFSVPYPSYSLPGKPTTWFTSNGRLTACAGH